MIQINWSTGCTQNTGKELRASSDIWDSLTGADAASNGYQSVSDPIWGTDTTSTFAIKGVTPNEAIYVISGPQMKNRNFSCVTIDGGEPPYVDPYGLIEWRGGWYWGSERSVRK